MDIDQIVTGVVLIILSSGLTALGFLFQRNKEFVTRSEVLSLLSDHSPWIKDKSFVLDNISRLNTASEKLDKLEIEYAKISVKIDELSANMVQFNHKLDIIVNRLEH